MIVLIDNYDSFTYNLYQYLGELGADVRVVRNDAVSIVELESLEPDAVDADALLVARLAWDTPGSSPGLPTLTTIDVFETSDCAALASACASC
jgi:hypothetical protein